jgi:hypothetical protein
MTVFELPGEEENAAIGWTSNMQNRMNASGRNECRQRQLDAVSVRSDGEWLKTRSVIIESLPLLSGE